MLRNQPDVIKRRPHYRLQKTTLGVASVLLSTTLYFGLTAHADTTTQPVNNGGDAAELQTSGQAQPYSVNAKSAALPAAGPAANETGSGAANDAGTTNLNTPSGASDKAGDAVNSDNTSHAPSNEADNAVNSDNAGHAASDKAGNAVNSDNASHSASNEANKADNTSAAKNALFPEIVLAAENPAAKPAEKPASDPAELTKTITRTINISNPDGTNSSSTQTITYTRTNANSPWTTDNDTFAMFNIPRISGYTPYDADGGNAVQNGRVVAVRTTANMQDLVVNVKYRQEQGSVSVNIEDENGTIIANKVVTGPDGSTQPVALAVPDGYVLDSGQSVPAQVTINGNLTQTIRVHALVVTVNPDDPQTAGTRIPGTQNLTFPSGVSEHDLNRTFTRKIRITKADGTTQVVTQPAVSFHRVAKVNAATGQVTYDAWDHATAMVPAYDLNTPEGQVAIVNGSLGALTVNPDTVSMVVDARFEVSDASVTVQFVDADDPDAGEVDETNVNGVIGQAVAVNLTVPDGWELAPGQSLPTTIKLTSADQDPIVIKLVARKVTVTPEDPKTPDDTIPGTNDNYNYPDGVAKDDLNKTVTRDIYVKLPGQAAVKETTQSVTVKRSATVNVITSEVTYGPWSKANFEAYKAPAEENYTVDQSQAPVSAVEFDKDGNPVNQSFTFNYSDATQDVTDAKDVTRTIYTQIEGQAQQKVDTQTLTLHRTGVKDLATGKVAWQAWQSDQFAAVTAPVVAGYTVINPEVGDAVTADGTQDHYSVVFQYVANAQSANVVYKDGNTVVTTVPLSGKTGESVAVHLNIPANYTQKSVESNANYDAATGKYTFSANNNGDLIVQLNHVTEPANDAKTLTRTIRVTNPVTGQTQTTEQKVTLTRTGTTDKVTGDTTWGDWTTGSWDKFEVPVVAGYTPSTNSVPAQTVTSETVPSTVEITYTANGQTANIVYVDQTTGQTVKTQPITGTTGETIKVGYQVPANYHIVSGKVDSYTFQAGNNSAITVQLGHDTQMVNDAKEVTRIIKVIALDGSVATQRQIAHLTRTGSKDLVTGKTAWQAWSTDTWAKYDVPVVAGYTPTMAEVPAVTVDGNTADSTVEIGYTANAESVNVVYKDGNKVVKLQPVTGKTGQTVTIDYQVPENYHVTNKPAATHTFTADANTDIVVELGHNMTAVHDTKAIVRTINVTNPDGQVKATKQTVNLTRDGQKDAVTGSVAWQAWSTGAWDQFDTPVLAGYTASMAKVDGAQVTSETKPVTVDITYTANEQTVKLVYKTPDGTTVKTETVTGKTGQTVKIPSDVPAGYETQGKVPSEVTVQPNGTPDVIITVAPKMSAVTDVKTVTRTINVTSPDGSVKTTKQVAHLTRTGNKNEVTGVITWGAWSTDNWNQFEVPTINGYTPSMTKVAGTQVTSETKPVTVEITYTANVQTVTVVYQTPDGTTVQTETVTGKTGQTVKIPSDVPVGYEIQGKVPIEVTVQPNGTPDVIITVAPKLSAVTDAKTVTRTINVTNPDGSVKTTKQVAHLTRTGTKNEVTGSITWGAWSTGAWDQFDTPVLAGYTPSMTKVDGAQVTGETKPVTVDVTYTANEQTVNVVYKTPDGTLVKTETVTGKTGQTVKLPNNVPAGYETQGKVPSEVTVQPNGTPDVIVTVAPKMSAVTDVKTVTRTINVTNPDGSVKTTKQVANLSRSGVKNAVTSAITWGAWSTDNWSQFDVPTINGYTPSLTKVEGTRVTSETKPVTVDVTYTANEQTVTVVYKTPDGMTVKTETVTGKTGQTVKLPSDVPAGYETQGKVPSEVTVQPKGTPAVIITVVPKMSTVTDSKTVTRTINVTSPDGSMKTTKQAAHLIRTGNKNEVTGAITWDAWSTDNWNQFDVPTINGYTPSLTKVEGTCVTSETKSVTVDITYTANEQTVKLVYKTPDGTTVKTETVTGKTGQTVPVPSSVPENYHTTGKVPSEVTFLPNGTPDVVVTVEPNMAEVTDTKAVTRMIVVTNPDGSVKTTKQVANLTRTGNKNEATGAITWGAWSTDNWSQFDVPVIEGYTPSQSVVNAQVVDGSTEDTMVNISYTANDQEVNVIYKTPDGDVTKIVKIPGKTGETVKIPNDVPAGYHVIGKVPGELTITGNNPEVVIMVEKDKVPTNNGNNHEQSPMPQDQAVVSRTDHEISGVPAHGQNVAFDNGKASQPSQAPASKSGQLPQTGNTEKGALALGLSGMMAGLAGLFGMKKKEN